MKFKELPSFEYVNEVLIYFPETGELRWKRRIGQKTYEGEVAGSLTPKGYGYLQIKESSYAAHRIAWLMATGCQPNNQIDHINGKKDDNRIINLRDVSDHMNAQNTFGPHKNNKLQILGVTCKGKKFVATLKKNGKTVLSKTFLTAEEASMAYQEARAIHHEGYVP